MKRSIIIALVSIILSITATSCVTTVRPTHSKVVLIKKAPRDHKVVVIKGKRYYTWGGKHYVRTRRGFVFVRV
tara:strand:+ start:372128 stop:372346 length:219 start_codon:yes stop_codon:yes gene_type:complete